jgi:hypothetical protein
MRAAFLWVVFPLLLLPIQGSQALGSQLLATISGILLQTTIHESGHAGAAHFYGWNVDDFRPYPTMCGDRFAGGCVTSHPDYDPRLPDGGINKRYLRESRAISAAGTMASQLSVLLLTPFVAKTKSSSFIGETLRSMLYFQNLDWIFYVATDTLTGFKGDWYSVAQSNGVPTAYYLPPAALSYWALDRYRQHFLKRDRQVSSSPIIRPQWALKDRSTPWFGVHVMWTIL